MFLNWLGQNYSENGDKRKLNPMSVYFLGNNEGPVSHLFSFPSAALSGDPGERLLQLLRCALWHLFRRSQVSLFPSTLGTWWIMLRVPFVELHILAWLGQDLLGQNTLLFKFAWFAKILTEIFHLCLWVRLTYTFSFSSYSLFQSGIRVMFTI